MSNSSYTYTDNTKKILEMFDEAQERALIRIGMQAESYAKQELSKPKPHANGENRPNVDTGLLRNSITFAISGKSANISNYSADRGGESGQYSGNAPDEKDKAVYIGTNVEHGKDVELGTINSQAYPYLRPAATEHSDVYHRIFEDEMKNAKE